MIRPVHKLAILAGVFFASGIGSMAWSYLTLKKWQAAPAQVLRNELVTFKVGKTTRYRGEVELRFIAKDRLYRVPYSVPTTYKNFEAARDDLLRYKIKATTTVYWNPDNPMDFLVERKNTLRFFLIPFLLTATGAILGFICMMLLVSMRRWFCPGCATPVPLHHRYCFACGRKLPRAKKWIRDA